MTFEPWMIGVAILLYSLLLVFLSYKIGAHRSRKELVEKLAFTFCIFEQLSKEGKATVADGCEVSASDIQNTINSIK